MLKKYINQEESLGSCKLGSHQSNSWIPLSEFGGKNTWYFLLKPLPKVVRYKVEYCNPGNVLYSAIVKNLIYSIFLKN